MQKLPRGLRNNNPLNIRISSTPWQGKRTDNTDGTFEQFTELVWGIRAALVNIRTYIKRDHIDTIQGIISRWAPERDGNNTKTYVDFVCDKIKLAPGTRVRYTDKGYLCMLVWAMALVECGQDIGMGKVENAWALI